MVRGNKIRINKYKLEYIIKLVGIYICQKWHFTFHSIGSKMGNINVENFRMNYINVNHLVRLYDVGSRRAGRRIWLIGIGGIFCRRGEIWRTTRYIEWLSLERNRRMSRHIKWLSLEENKKRYRPKVASRKQQAESRKRKVESE